MRNVYKFAFVVVFLCFISKSYAEETLVESLRFYDLTHDRMNATHKDSFGNDISFYTNEPAVTGKGILYRAETNPLQCIGATPTNPPSGTDYEIMVIYGIKFATADNSPYYVIDLGANSDVRSIKVLGIGGGSNPSSSGEIIYALSSTTDNEDEYVLDDDTPSMFFNNGTCNVNEIIIPEGTRYVKFIIADQFGWAGVDSGTYNNNPPRIHSMIFYSKDTQVGINDNEQNNDIEIVNEGNGYYTFTKSASVEIFNLHGQKVLSLKDTTGFVLENQPKGVYIVRLNVNGTYITKKIVN